MTGKRDPFGVDCGLAAAEERRDETVDILDPMELGNTGKTAAEDEEVIGLPDQDDRPSTPERRAVVRDVSALCEQWDRQEAANSLPPNGTAVAAEMADGAEAVTAAFGAAAPTLPACAFRRDQRERKPPSDSASALEGEGSCGRVMCRSRRLRRRRPAPRWRAGARPAARALRD